MEYLFLIGRLIFGGYFLYSGINHFTKNDMLVGYAASKGVPFPKFSVSLSGLMILVGGLGVILGGDFLFWSLVLIAVFLLVISFKMHNFWSAQDLSAKMPDTLHFMKNMALLGATLMLMALAYDGQIFFLPWPFLL